MLAIVLSSIAYGDEFSRCYLHIQDDNYIPIVGGMDNGKLDISSKIENYNKLLQTFHFLQFERAFPGKAISLKHIYSVELKDSIEMFSFMSQISKNFSTPIPVVERQGITQLCGPKFIPNDSCYLSGEQTYLDLIRAPEAWYIARHYGKIKVGVSDFYYHQPHEDLVFDSIINNAPYNNDTRDHGTIVAGIIGTTTNNRVGISSVGGFNTQLMGAKSGLDNVWALANAGCKVINCSWYNSTYFIRSDELSCRSIVEDMDVVLVCAAGNFADQGGSLDRYLYPASYSSCLSVTSIGHKNNYGDPSGQHWKDVHLIDVNRPDSSHHHNAAVDICAPGYGIKSTNYWLNEAKYTDGSGLGTSFAAPLVSGVAAMVRAVNQNLSAIETIEIIKSTANSSIYQIPENEPFIGLLGTGRLDAYAAVRKACALDINNQTYDSDTVLQDACIITLQDVDIQDGASLTISPVVEAEIIRDFELPLGSTLTIQCHTSL